MASQEEKAKRLIDIQNTIQKVRGDTYFRVLRALASATALHGLAQTVIEESPPENRDHFHGISDALLIHLVREVLNTVYYKKSDNELTSLAKDLQKDLGAMIAAGSEVVDLGKRSDRSAE